MCRAAMSQYALAALTLICAVVVNLFGKESDALNSLFASIIAGAVWGGIQRGKEPGNKRVSNGNEDPAE